MIKNLKNINTLYKPKYYDDSPVNEVLKQSEIKINVVIKDESSKNVYKTFNEDFGLFLSKLPANNVKKYVSQVFNRGLVFIGFSDTRNENVFTRVLLTESDKLAAVVLNTQMLDITITTGETKSIDDCVYATYYGIIRAASIIFKNNIKSDKDLHSALSTYLYLLTLKLIEKGSIYSVKQKQLIHVVCLYAYYRHFLKFKPKMILNIINRQYLKFIKDVSKEEISNVIDKISNYNSTKDIGDMLVSSNVLIDKNLGRKFVINLLHSLKSTGFYAFTGPLDLFIGMCVLSNYPTNLYNRNVVVGDNKISKGVESLVEKYVKNIKYTMDLVK